MTRANARELAVHLIYGRDFTGEEPQQVVSIRLDKEYYSKLSAENEVYAERPNRAQLAYIDNVVAGVANRQEELNATIQKFSIGWDVTRISRLARSVMQLAIYEILYVEDVPTGLSWVKSNSIDCPSALDCCLHCADIVNLCSFAGVNHCVLCHVAERSCVPIEEVNAVPVTEACAGKNAC